jgi:hypothetical protein
MRVRQAAIPFIILILLLDPVHLYAGYVFDSQALEDDSGDTFNFERLLNEGVLEPQPTELDVQKVELVADAHPGSSLVELSLEVTLIAPPLPHMSYTVEFGLDTDSDPSTGASEPAAYYNGLGVDLDIGLAVEAGVVASTWVDRFEAGSWVRLGEAGGYVQGSRVVVYIPLDLVPHPMDASGTVYLISGGALDMVPRVRLLFHYTPDASMLNPPIVDEGADCPLDASPSFSMYGIALYEWDLDGDGLYEKSSGAPTITASFPGDGLNSVTLRVIDTMGFADTRTRTVTVVNLPPAGLEAGYTGEAKAGNALTFTAAAIDPGGDPLTYEWSFGDDSTSEGPEVLHTYVEAGFRIVTVTVRDDAGAETTAVLSMEVAPAATQPVNGDGAGAPPLDPLLLILVIVFGLAGFFVYNIIKGKKKEKPPKRDDKKKKGFCEEHPEVVEEETHKCEDALIDLDSAIGDVQDSFDEAEPRWRSNVNEIGRLLVEWDGVISLIAHWTKSEKALQADAEKVQKVAGLVTSAGGMAKTASKEGGEAAMKELGKDVAKDIAGSIAGELSGTVGDLLELEDWAIREIGLGIAKGLTGIDPKGNAVKLRKNSEVLLTQLLSWVDHSEAWNLGRRPPDTLPSMREEADGMLKALDDALKNFEDAVAGFVCVTCKIPENIQQEIDELRGKLEKWKQTFDDLEKQVQKRLDQARAMYKRKSLYESPYEYASKADRNIERIDRAREEGP